jgi:hypothetical protein
MVLLMPRETFEKRLRIEGCEVQPIAAFEDQDLGASESQTPWWNFFPFPQTQDGRRLANISHALLSCAAQLMADPPHMQRFAPLHLPEHPIGNIEQFVRFEAPGPKQQISVPYRPLFYRPLQGPMMTMK